MFLPLVFQGKIFSGAGLSPYPSKQEQTSNPNTCLQPPCVINCRVRLQEKSWLNPLHGSAVAPWQCGHLLGIATPHPHRVWHRFHGDFQGSPCSRRKVCRTHPRKSSEGAELCTSRVSKTSLLSRQILACCRVESQPGSHSHLYPL